MILEAISPEYEKYTTVDTEPTPESIRAYVESLPWDDITFVRIKKDETHWVECSGSHPDGFSVIYQEGTETFITQDEPEGLEQLILTMQDFSIGGNDWKSICRWSPHGGRKEGSKSGCAAVIAFAFLLISGTLLLDKII
ncbi:hypothetical protein [Pelagicoccus sp. SDUM812003]|uniref:hypothetical protein n=1 Tax=Pelagicoccus sp. SDUM812003 TaxID=3041267 RepID=UPI00280DC917|nr:hypothetical protein [Pelagicoccus sp. SDUM812003]MDQ8205825.1 hypothetical protein [Pelagicoccus sp. SDUM812003]